MDVSLLLLVALVVALSSVIQSMVGFGLALFAIPGLILLGLSLPEAVTVSLVGTLAQGVVAAVQLRTHVQWRALAPLAAVRLLSLPLGLAVMGVLVEWGPERMKQGVGLALLLVLVLWSAIRVQPRARVSTGWGIAAGAGSGLLGGSVGMGGPPCVLWALAHRWSSEQLRGSLIVIFMITIPFQLGLLWWQHGPDTLQGLLLGALTTPLMIGGAALGLRLSAWLPTERLRRTMYALLVGIALYAVISPVALGLAK